MKDSKITLHEKDIAQIVVFENDKEVRYTKINREDTIYHITYTVDTEEGQTFCPFCGTVSEITEGEDFICPKCNFEDRQYIRAEDVPELIYSSLKEGSEVVINTAGGNNYRLKK